MKEEIEQFITDSITADKNITDVIALRAGYGKSQYITKQMSDKLMSNGGLMVVTDSIDRLEEILKGQTVNDDIAVYMKRNEKRIAFLTADNFKTEIKTASYKPIIAMTTQRFFRLKPTEINQIIKDSRYKIEQILIDEQPSILEVKNIGIEQLTEIDRVINTALTNLIDQQEKQQIIDCFEQINTSFRRAFKDAESRNESGYYSQYYFDSDLKTSSDTLFRLTDKYKSDLNTSDYDVVNLIDTLSFIASDGGMIVSQKLKSKDDTNNYNNYISAVVDYRRWFEEIDTKIIIFDATADINPLYDKEHFNIVDCKKVETRIPRLNINIVDISASKTKLIKEPLHLQAIIDYLKAEPQQTQAVFTYKDIESQFADITENTAHFGDIKGHNKYRYLTNITQVGLNRYPDHVYKFLCGYSQGTKIESNQEIVLSDNAIRWFKSQGIKNISQITKSKSTLKIITMKHLIRYRNMLILSDIVQNIFRSNIRENSGKQVTYNLIFSYTANNDESQANRELVDLIRQYFIPIGATVELTALPRQIREYKIAKQNNKEKSRAQRILEWIQSKPTGYKFTPKEVQQDLGITDNRLWYSSINGNNNLRSLLKQMKVTNGVYKA